MDDTQIDRLKRVFVHCAFLTLILGGIITAWLIAIGLFVWAFDPAFAQSASACGTRVDVMKMLVEKYGEHVVAHAVSPQGNTVEVTASRSGSWTMLVSNNAGLACIFASGKDWNAKVWPDNSA